VLLKREIIDPEPTTSKLPVGDVVPIPTLPSIITPLVGGVVK
jgi:hypothetical protein